MFPIDSETVDYNQKMVEQFDELKKEKDIHGNCERSCHRFCLQEKTQVR